MHEQNNTVDKPMAQIPFELLSPGASALEEIQKLEMKGFDLEINDGKGSDLFYKATKKPGGEKFLDNHKELRDWI